MHVTVQYFAWLRERLGRDGEVATVPDGATVGALLDALAGGNPGVLDDRSVIRAAVNQTVAPMTTVLADGDAVAFFPPMTGG